MGVRDHRVGKPEHEGHRKEVPLQLLEGHHPSAEAVAQDHLDHDDEDQQEIGPAQDVTETQGEPVDSHRRCPCAAVFSGCFMIASICT